MHSTFALMRVAYRLGDWDRVEACLEDHLANFALETGVRCINVQMGPSEGALVLAHRGDTQRALELARLPFPFERIVGPTRGRKQVPWWRQVPSMRVSTSPSGSWLPRHAGARSKRPWLPWKHRPSIGRRMR